MIGQRIAFLCNASHWTNNSGQPVRSLWIDQVGTPGVGSPAMAGPQQPQAASNLPAGQMTAGPQIVVQPQIQGLPQYDDDPKQGKIHRQTATKVAAILLSNLPTEERNMNTLLALSERLVAYYDNGVTQAETVEDLMNRAMPQGMDPGSPIPASAYDQGGGYTGDDDIPF